MTKALIVVIAVVLTLATSARAWSAVEGASTIERMNTLIQRSLAEVARQVSADSVSIGIATHPDAEFIRVMAIDAFGNRVVSNASATNADVFITPIDISTRYEACEAADSIDRVISATMKAVLTENGTVTPLQTLNVVERERMHRKDAVRLQSTQRMSTHGQIPPMATTIWDDILQPAIFVAAAVTTVVLLFTVRSQ